ncbi:hypothetical protein MHU86_3191 [Fragilaria crotonensis]|nr:hypothetical protein MHU86_3191 [Fragilaria crotonensis]
MSSAVESDAEDDEERTGDGNTLRIPSVEDSDPSGEEFLDNYEMLESVDGEYTLSEKMCHYVGGHIMPEHWVACKASNPCVLCRVNDMQIGPNNKDGQGSGDSSSLQQCDC